MLEVYYDGQTMWQTPLRRGLLQVPHILVRVKTLALSEADASVTFSDPSGKCTAGCGIAEAYVAVQPFRWHGQAWFGVVQILAEIVMSHRSSK